MLICCEYIHECRTDIETFPFTISLARRQFPILPAYVITINKSQGQTYEYVEIYLRNVVFGHGQAYVALYCLEVKQEEILKFM